ncbi:MAG: GspE/PulE family protein [Patescibacteria group bacterium]|nr:GspE/PulE family protein [Patescibacteria group bacterium]
METAKIPNPASGVNLLDYLVKQKLATSEQIELWKKEAWVRGKSVVEFIEESKEIKDEDLTVAKSKAYNIPTIELFGRIVSLEVLRIIPEEIATNYKIICFAQDGKVCSIGLVDPGNYKAIEAVEFIARKNGYQIKYYAISLSAYKYILRQYQSLSSEVEQALKGTPAGEDIVSKVEIAEKGFEEVVRSAPVAKMVNVILEHAVEGKASDVHIEPLAEETRVRYRIDGILHTTLILPKAVNSSIIARVKVLSNLKIDETRVPQDGRFRKKFESGDVDFRVSTLPVVDNEKVVMRILDTSSNVLDLERLGFWGKSLKIMKDNIDKPHGMFLITGPTGSGKSTTLYALIHLLNKEAVNIVTLEDPVEYYQKGVNQSQVNPEVGLTFARGLRSILRQDPDIIMVGEIRDAETAELAVHASLTGHIVLSTLHTNDAFGAVPRLVDMKIEPFLLTSSLNLVMAQRLVRKLCDHCKEEIILPKRYEDDVWRSLSTLPKEALPKDLKLVRPLRFHRGKGCVRCENTGYKGRISIAEVLEITEELKKIILAGCELDKIKAEFNKQGMHSMIQDGYIKSLQGKTTVEEVIKVTKE